MRDLTTSPVWTWVCDRCGISSGDLAVLQEQLPTAREMRARGWYIAKAPGGDRCPHCNERRKRSQP